MKLYGKKLDKELARRRRILEKNRNNRITLRMAARMFGPKMGLKSPSEYCDWIYGHDICPHKEGFEKILAGIHPPFLVLTRCKKCGYVKKSCKPEDLKKEEAKEVFNEMIKYGVITQANEHPKK